MATKKALDVKPGLARLRAPEGISGIGFEGVEYEVKDGLVDVPAEIASAFIAGHGFTATE
jgi:hypothetical protein